MHKKSPMYRFWHMGDCCVRLWFLTGTHRAPIVDAHQGDDGLFDGVVALTGEGCAGSAIHDTPVVDGLYAVHGPVSDAVDERQGGIKISVRIEATAGFLVDDGHQTSEHGRRLFTGDVIVRSDIHAGTAVSTVVAAEDAQIIRFV